MCQFLFCKIMQDVCAYDFYFLEKSNACGVISLSSIQKCTNTMIMLAYGLVVNACNEYCRIRERTTIKCLK
jgi:hypothetical protein